jgi:hypothetical protein
MPFVLAIFLFFSSAFDSCFAEALAHSTVIEVATTHANSTHHGCTETENSDSSESDHEDVCHACGNCHNWLETLVNYITPHTDLLLGENYNFVLPRPEIQKIERPPIHSKI